MSQTLWSRSRAFISKTLGEFIFPPLCIICDSFRLPGNKWFCQKCLATLSQNNSQRESCPICSLNTKLKECTCDIVNSFPFECSYALFDFDESVRTVLHHIKYHGKKNLAFDLGIQFGTLIPDSFFDSIDFAIAIPLHWTRYLKRGYNQADWIGNGILKCKNRTIPLLTDCLQRTKPTRTQTKLNKESRKQNISNVFRVRQPELIRGKNCILFDDVLTTGATTAECTRTLLKAGCTSVRVLALVRD